MSRVLSHMTRRGGDNVLSQQLHWSCCNGNMTATECLKERALNSTAFIHNAAIIPGEEGRG